MNPEWCHICWPETSRLLRIQGHPMADNASDERGLCTALELLRPPVNQCPSQVMTQQHQSSPNQKNILDNEAVNATQLQQEGSG